MDHVELYRLAKEGDPACIEGLLDLITQGALEILRLECRCETNEQTPMEESLQEVRFRRARHMTRLNIKVYESRALK